MRIFPDRDRSANALHSLNDLLQVYMGYGNYTQSDYGER